MGNIVINKVDNTKFTVKAISQNSDKLEPDVHKIRVSNGVNEPIEVIFQQNGRSAIESISASPINVVNGADPQNISAIVTPNNDNVLYNLTYSSSNDDVATVDENGVVTFTGIGETTITITDTISGKTISIIVTVSARKYNVAYTLNHCDASNHSDATEGQNYSTTITSDNGYDLPTSAEVVVEMNGVRLNAGTGYNYNTNSGEIVVYNVSGRISITASANMHEFSVTPPIHEVGWNETNILKTYTVTSNTDWTITDITEITEP